MKRFLLWAALLAPCSAVAADLQTQLIGARVTGEFTLGPSIFYVPEGQWVLAARQTWTGNLQYVLQGPKFAGVVLFDVREQQVARALWVRTNIEPVLGTRGWVKEEDPCKVREDIYLHRELGANYQNQYCIQVNHRLPFFAGGTGVVRDAQGWLVDNKLPLPRAMVGVHFARIDRAYNTQLHYYFNPELDGLAPSAAAKWNASEWHRDRVGKDPARAAYLEALAKWAGDAASPVYAGFTDAKLKAAFPQPPFPAKR